MDAAFYPGGPLGWDFLVLLRGKLNETNPLCHTPLCHQLTVWLMYSWILSLWGKKEGTNHDESDRSNLSCPYSSTSSTATPSYQGRLNHLPKTPASAVPLFKIPFSSHTYRSPPNSTLNPLSGPVLVCARQPRLSILPIFLKPQNPQPHSHPSINPSSH